MRHFHSALERIAAAGEAGILGAAFRLSRGQIHRGLIAAMMTEFELFSFAAEREPHDLMAEANPEDRFFAEQFFYILSGVRHRVGITGTVRKKDTIRVERQHRSEERRV